jgi:hypothetical protein
VGEVEEVESGYRYIDGDALENGDLIVSPKRRDNSPTRGGHILEDAVGKNQCSYEISIKIIMYLDLVKMNFPSASSTVK